MRVTSFVLTLALLVPAMVACRSALPATASPTATSLSTPVVTSSPSAIPVVSIKTEIPSATLPPPAIQPTQPFATDTPVPPAATLGPGEPLFLPGTPFPSLTEPITIRNFDALVPLVHWGMGFPQEVRYSADGKLLGVLTQAGRTIYDGTNLAMLPFNADAWETIFPPAAGVYSVTGSQCPDTKEPCKYYELDKAGAKVADLDLTGPYAFSPDQTRLAGEVFNGATIELHIWDTGTGQVALTQNFSVEDTAGKEISCLHDITALAYTPDGTHLAAACSQGQVYLFNSADAAPVQTLAVGGDIIMLSFSSNGQVMAAVTLQGVRLWSLAAGSSLDALQDVEHVPGDALKTVAFAPDGTALAGAYPHGPLVVWSLKDGTLLKELMSIVPQGGLRFSPDGRQLAYLTGSQVVVADIATGAPAYTIKSDTAKESDQPIAVEFSLDGRYLAVLRLNNNLVVFRPPASVGGQPEFVGFTRLDVLNFNMISRFAFHPDGKRLAVHQNDQIVLLDLDDLAPAGAIRALPGFTGFAFSPDGQLVAIGGEEIQIRAVETGKVLERISVKYDPGEPTTVDEVAFSPDGSLLLADTTNGSRVFETNKWTMVAKISEQYLAFGWHGISPDGSLLVTPGKGGKLVLRRPSDGAGLASLDGSEKRGYSPVFSPDGALLATWSTDGTIWLWGIVK